MPPAILTARCGVHVENGVDAVFRARCDGSVEVFKPRLFQNAGIQVVFEVTVVDRDADAVQSERLEECSVGFGEEVLQELKVEKIGV